MGGDLEIYSNSSLTNLSGLNALVIVGGRIDINNNYALVSLAGLSSLTTLVQGLSIYSNPSLCDSLAQALRIWLQNHGWSGYANIHDNNNGC